jgi:RNA polymerase sigma-70 factor (ECF subfamily)
MGYEVRNHADWVRVFEQQFKYVHRTLLHRGVAATEAEDLAQDVFLVAWRRWRDYEPERPVRPWLAGIAVRLAMKHVDRRRREIPLPEADPIDAAPLPDERLASERARTFALQVIAALPTRHRTALIQHELDGVSVKDLATLWSVPLPTAYTRVRAARSAFAISVAGRSPAEIH